MMQEMFLSAARPFYHSADIFCVDKSVDKSNVWE